MVHKPSGVPVAPCVDNMLECTLTCTAQVCLSPAQERPERLPNCSKLTVLSLQQALGQREPLLITHRLDACTEGIHVLAKTREFAGHFNGLIRLPGSVQKWYRALSAQPPPVGGSPALVLASAALRVVASSGRCWRLLLSVARDDDVLLCRGAYSPPPDQSTHCWPDTAHSRNGSCCAWQPGKHLRGLAGVCMQ